VPEVAVVGFDEPLVSGARGRACVGVLGHGAHKLAQGGTGAKETQAEARAVPSSQEQGTRSSTPLLGLSIRLFTFSECRRDANGS